MLRDYLEVIVTLRSSIKSDYHYQGIEDLLLREGKWFSPIERPATIKKMKNRECFKNAYEVACRFPKYTYTEGYAYNHRLIPVEHAWVTDQDGNAIEVTWKESGDEYCGLQFPLELVEKVMLVRGYYGMLGDYENDMPILKSKLSLENLDQIYSDLLLTN